MRVLGDFEVFAEENHLEVEGVRVYMAVQSEQVLQCSIERIKSAIEHHLLRGL